MQIKIDKSLLSNSLSRVSGAISEKNNAEIGFKASPGQMVVTGKDRHMAIYCTAECEATTEGEVFVAAKIISDVCRELPSGPVLLKQKESFLHITAGPQEEFHMKIPLVVDSTWVSEPNFKEIGSVVLDSGKFTYMIQQVNFCISMESAQNYGAVGYLHKNEQGTLRLVGTDGYRLSFCDLDCDVPEGIFDQGVCLTKRALNECIKICNEGYETVKVSLSDDRSVFVISAPGYRIYIKLSNVNYPNYQGVLPSKGPNLIEISRPTLHAVTKRVMLSTDKTRVVRMDVNSEQLKLSAKNTGGSESSETVPLIGEIQSPTQLAVNGKYLSDVFSNTTSVELKMEFKEKSDPFIIIPVNEPEKCSSRHIFVPIHEN